MYKVIESTLDQAINFSNENLRSVLSSRSLRDHECKLCGRTLDASSRDRLERSGSFSKADGGPKNLDDVKELVFRLSQLDEFRSIDKRDNLRLLEEERFSARADIYSNSQKAEEIRADHSNRPRGDLAEKMSRFEKIKADIIRTETSRVNATEELDKCNQEINRLHKQINRIEIDPRIQRKARAANLAVEATKRALEEFRESARGRVENEASKIFKMLVKEPGYHGIRIDDDYRVTPIDVSGDVLPIPSAGGQQLVTLSLVGGLNAAAIHQAPIVMDTPAGRVDKRNRERILHWISEIDEQAILMVHSGEFTRDEIETSGIPVAHAYEIEKTGAKTSEIRRIGT